MYGSIAAESLLQIFVCGKVTYRDLQLHSRINSLVLHHYQRCFRLHIAKCVFFFLHGSSGTFALAGLCVVAGVVSIVKIKVRILILGWGHKQWPYRILYVADGRNVRIFCV